MIRIDTEKLPILIWAEPEDLVGYDDAIAQAKNLANHPIARKHIALMPDFHVGYGMPIGGVLATQSGVIPNAVGVDIGCGMIACRTDIEAEELGRDTLQEIRTEIHARIPVGAGPGGTHKADQPMAWSKDVDLKRLPVIASNYRLASRQMGTLGSGNHFIEIQKDETGHVWLMVHSGSRGIGTKVCNHYDKVARSYMKQFHSTVPAEDLAFVPQALPEYGEYLASMNWCCRFAEANRGQMLSIVIGCVENALGRSFETEERIETHHNYAAVEHHMGEELLVHRKGAVRADGPVIIPGSMGTASYVGRGKAEVSSFMTCSHGAGRVLGRRQANRTITHEQALDAMKHVVFGVRQGDYEEMPQAYKDIDRVIANQTDLVEATHRLTPLAVVKG